MSFEKYTERLVEEMRNASMHFDLYRNLRASIKNFEAGINCSPNFWSLTLNAHLEATRSSLCRLFDQTARTINLREWLREFERNELKEEHFQTSEQDKFNRTPLRGGEIKEDIQLVSVKDPLVEILFCKHRNNEISHISKKLAARGESFFETYPLSVTDIEKLINRSRDLINKYSAHFNGTIYAAISPYQNGDFRFVLESIQRSVMEAGNPRH